MGRKWVAKGRGRHVALVESRGRRVQPTDVSPLCREHNEILRGKYVRSVDRKSGNERGRG